MSKTVTRTLTAMAVLLTASTAAIYYQNYQVPKLGLEQGRFQPLSSKPNCVSTQATDLQKRVEPLPFGDTTEQTMAALKKAISAHGGENILKEEPTYLRVVFTTPVMRFNDDAEFWLDAENKEVHFRSAARAGYSDMGNNKKRYDKLRELYLQEL